MITIITGSNKHDEERRHDQEHDREEDLDRCLLSTLLGVGPLALAHLDGEVAHDLTRRDAHRLALRDRPREHPHAGRVHPDEEMVECFDERQAHVLLLQGEADLSRRAAPWIFRDAIRRDCGKLRPASSVTTRRSIRSGRPRSTWSRRLRVREPTMYIGSIQPSNAGADDGQGRGAAALPPASVVSQTARKAARDSGRATASRAGAPAWTRTCPRR